MNEPKRRRFSRGHVKEHNSNDTYPFHLLRIEGSERSPHIVVAKRIEEKEWR